MASTTGKTTRSAANKASGSIDTDEAVDSGFSSAQQSHLSRIIAEAMNLQAERLEDKLQKLKEDDARARQAKPTDKGGRHHVVSDSSGEEGEVSADEAEAYLQSLGQSLQEGEKTGKALPDDIVRVFSKAIGSPIDAKIVKEKRDGFPRPANAATLKSPELNEALAKALTPIGVKLDKKLADVQKNMIAAMAAVATQATFLWELKDFIKSGVAPQVKEHLPLVSRGFVALMDANILLTRSLSNITHARREAVKLCLNKDVGAVLSDKNPATPEWLAGPDLTAEFDRVEKERKDIAKMKHFSFSHPNQGGYQSTSENKQGYGGGNKNKHQSKSRSNSSYKKDKKPYNTGNKKKHSRDKEDFHRRGAH